MGIGIVGGGGADAKRRAVAPLGRTSLATGGHRLAPLPPFSSAAAASSSSSALAGGGENDHPPRPISVEDDVRRQPFSTIARLFVAGIVCRWRCVRRRPLLRGASAALLSLSLLLSGGGLGGWKSPPHARAAAADIRARGWLGC